MFLPNLLSYSINISCFNHPLLLHQVCMCMWRIFTALDVMYECLNNTVIKWITQRLNNMNQGNVLSHIGTGHPASNLCLFSVRIKKPRSFQHILWVFLVCPPCLHGRNLLFVKRKTWLLQVKHVLFVVVSVSISYHLHDSFQTYEKIDRFALRRRIPCCKGGKI